MAHGPGRGAAVSLSPADRAWLTTGLVVAGWDLIGPETLSGAVDRYHHR